MARHLKKIFLLKYFISLLSIPNTKIKQVNAKKLNFLKKDRLINRQTKHTLGASDLILLHYNFPNM